MKERLINWLNKILPPRLKPAPKWTLACEKCGFRYPDENRQGSIICQTCNTPMTFSEDK